MNYKHPVNNVLDIGGNKYIIKSNETIKVLFSPTMSMTATGVTYHDMDDATNYQVPTGKTFKIIGMTVKQPTSGTQFVIITSTTAVDSNTGEVILVKYNPVQLDGSTSDFPLRPTTIAADLFINVKSGGAQSSTCAVLLYGVVY